MDQPISDQASTYLVLTQKLRSSRMQDEMFQEVVLRRIDEEYTWNFQSPNKIPLFIFSNTLLKDNMLQQ